MWGPDMGLWKFLIKILLVGSIRCDSTTPTYEYEECPEGFQLTTSNDTCYVIAETCPYHSTVPFEQYQEIEDFANLTYKLGVSKIDKNEYLQWYDMLGKFGELFIEGLDGGETHYSTIGRSVVFNGTYFSTDDNGTEQICAYNTSKETYCSLYDQICGGNRTNCHCGTTVNQFCSLQCGNDTYNNDKCRSCPAIVQKYKEPKITMSLSYDRTLVFVAVKSFLKLLPLQDEHLIYCFTDGNISERDVSYRFSSTKIPRYDMNDDLQQYTIHPVKNTIGHYWCKGFWYDNANEVNSATIIAQGTNVNESFTLNVTVNETERKHPLTIHEEVLNKIIDETIVGELNDTITHINFLKLYPRRRNTTKIAYRLYFNETNKWNLTMEDVLNKTTSAFNSTDYNNVTMGPSYCLPEVLNNLTWEKTLLGSTAISYELCLKENSVPVTRKCAGEYLYGTYWEDPSGSCLNDNGSIHTIHLHNLSHSGRPPSEKIQALKEVLADQNEKILIDIHFIAQVFNNITDSGSFELEELTEVASDIMDVDREVLRQAQQLLNTTDMLLYSLGKALASWNYNDSNQTFTSNNIFVAVTKIPEDSGGIGAAFYETNSKISIELLTNSSLHPSNPKLKVFVDLQQQFPKINYTTARLVIAAFRYDSLFNQKAMTTTKGFTVSAFMIGFDDPYLKDPVEVYIRPDRRYRATFSCYYWEYGRNWQWYNSFGEWMNESLADYDNVGVTCKYHMFRSFGIMIGVEDDVVLSIISAVGCGLSMTGSLAVVVTGTVYQSWREQSGTKILLNFAVTNFFQNIILAANSGVDSAKQEVMCIVMGASLHYSVLSQFTWMMIIGYMQYLRYVEVFYTIPQRFVLMASIAAWLIPVVPVVAVLSWDYTSYNHVSYCYLQDRPLFFTVFIPAGFSLTTNFIIVGIIIYHVYCKKTPSGSHRDNISWLNLRLVILLFFLLGLYWLFGIAARFTQLVAFDYFFCICAALQGFVVFFYFLVFNKMTRNFWMRQLRRSEMIMTMQIWLQQRRKIGKVKLDKSSVRRAKMRIVENLKEKKHGAVKFA